MYRSAWLVSLALVVTALVAPSAVYAEAPTQTQDVYAFDMPPQALATSLRQLGSQTHLNVMFDPATVAGVQAPRLKGRYEPKEALRKLLAGTRLTTHFTSAATVVVVERSPPSASPPPAPPAPTSTARSREKAPLQQLAPITVTGTHIAGIGSSPTLPKITITHEQIVQRGYNNLSDLLRSVSMNYSNMGVSSYADSNSGAPQYSAGLTAVNLRGLGTGDTLVLIDGHRTANAPTQSGTMVDISKIPIAMIQSVEIITGPAAAIYGSDAVAGVVNIITRKDYTGSQTYVGYANSSTDADLREFRQLLGFGWGSGNLTFNADYQKRDGASLAGLGVTSADQRFRGGRDYRNFTYSTPGQLRSNSYYGITIPGAPSGTSSALLPGGDGKNVNTDDLVYISNSDWRLKTGNYGLINPSSGRVEGYLTPDTRDVSGSVNLTQQLNKTTNLSMGLMYSNRHWVTTQFGYPAIEIVPESNAYNHFGQPVMLIFDWASEFGRRFSLPSTGTSIDAGANATLSFELPWRDWSGKFEATGSRSSYDLDQTGFVSEFYGEGELEAPQHYAALVAALNSSDPAQALNLFGSNAPQPGGFTPDDFLYHSSLGSRVSKSWSTNADVNGTVFSLPTGEVKLAVGVALRRDSLNFKQFTLSALVSTPPVRMLNGYYAELFIPLMHKDASGRSPLILQIADRYDSYSIRGPFGSGDGSDPSESTGALETKQFSASSPDIGLRWQPNREWAFTANWGKSYQTPTLQDLFGERYGFRDTDYDPYNPESNGGPKVVSYLVEGGGNPSLKPQTSISTTLSATYSPAVLPGLIATVAYSNIKVTNLIAPGISDYNTALEFPALNPGVVRDSNGVLLRMDSSPINASIQRSKALDIRVAYNFHTSWGYFEAGLAGTYTQQLSQQITAQAPIVYSQGCVIGPSKWHVIPSLVWNRGSWSANVFWDYYSGVLNSDPSSPQRRVAGIGTMDVQAGWHSSDDRLSVVLGAHNVFDKRPPFYDSRYGIDFSRYNSVGREIYVNFTVSFGREQ